MGHIYTDSIGGSELFSADELCFAFNRSKPEGNRALDWCTSRDSSRVSRLRFSHFGVAAQSARIDETFKEMGSSHASIRCNLSP